MLQADRLTKVYHTGAVETRALVDASFKVPEGQFLSIIGKSGSGKSTLMHLLSLLDTPTSGDVTIDGYCGCDMSFKQQTQFRLHRFGFVFQDYALLGELSATDNVAVPLLMQGNAKEQAREQSRVVLSRLGLGHRLDNMPNQLSGGEQQRVSVARAIAHNPRIVFADEPTANLDSETSQLIIDYFRELNDKGQTIIMVTHEEEYSQQTDRVLTLSDGEIVSDEE